jgi:hypothetical protein
MKTVFLRSLIGAALAMALAGGYAQTVLPSCQGSNVSQWHACRGVFDDPEFSYAGDFMRGKFEGRGILEFTAEKYQGDHYQGEFKNGMKHGFGIYFFANGEKYAGQYLFGKRHGKGTYSYPDGRAALTGQWVNNQFVGKPSGTDTKPTSAKVNASGIDTEKKKTEPIGLQRPVKQLDRASDVQAYRPTPWRDAVAIVVGVANYQRLPTASFANKDAAQFRDHATRYLGIAPENIKTLTDSEAQRSEILLALKYWLPSRVNAGKTDVFVYFSGHGVAQDMAKQHYLLPVDANTDLLEDTALSQHHIFHQLSKVGAKSVTVFLDTCFSGTDRMGQALAQYQRGVTVKSNASVMPTGVNLLTAGTPSQSAYGDVQLQQGVFSYFLFKGLAGEADANGDMRVSLGELADYVQTRTYKHALGIRKVQEPQFAGDRQYFVVTR